MQNFKFTALQINNFRVFNLPTAFNLAPLTILTGKNNSGKSSLHKALRLLQASYSTSGLRQLAFMHPGVNVGDFESARNHQSNTDEMTFTITATHEVLHIPREVTAVLQYHRSSLKHVTVYEQDVPILRFELTDEGEYKNTFLCLPVTVIDEKALREELPHLLADQLVEVIGDLHHALQTDTTIHTFYIDSSEADGDIISGAFKDFANSILSLGGNFMHSYPGLSGSHDPTLADVFPGKEHMVNTQELQSQYLRDFIDYRALKIYAAMFPKITETLFKRLIFIDNISLIPQPVYTAQSAPSFFNLLEKASAQLPKVNRFLKEWLVEKFDLLDASEVGSNFFLIRNVDGFGYRPQFKIGNKYIDLSKMGKGITQILPVLLTAMFHADSIFVVEEPETNLHPAAQSLLADFFAGRVKVEWEEYEDEYHENQFIIETHSEYLVRKLKYLTAAGTIRPEDSVILYFEGAGKGVKHIRISENGSLSDNFGAGFFDEAGKIDLSIARLGEQQRN